MSTEQTPVELTTRDVLLQVDRRLSLIEGDLRGLDEKVEALDLRLTTKLDDKIDGLRNEMTSQNTSLRSEMTAQSTGLRNEMTSQSTGLRNEMTSQNTSLRNETKAEFDGLRSEMTAGFARADIKIDALDAKFATLHLDTTQDILSVRQEILAVKQDLHALELRLTVRLGGMMVVGITVVATLVKLL